MERRRKRVEKRLAVFEDDFFFGGYRMFDHDRINAGYRNRMTEAFVIANIFMLGIGVLFVGNRNGII